MTNQLFNFNNNEVSVIINDNNEPLFIAKEVCNILGYTKSTSSVIETHCKKQGSTKMVLPSNGGMQEMILINEGNLYRLILKSKKKEAEKFETWVCDEVLPSIRKNGMYATAPTIDEMLANPEFAIKTLEALQKERQEKQLLAQQNEQLLETSRLQTAQLQIASPMVAYYEVVLQSNSTYTTNQIAKELGYSAVSFNKLLHDWHIQYKQSDTWLLYTKYQNKGYTKTKTYTFNDSNGVPKTSMATVWTEKGRKFLHDLVTKKIAV